MDEDANSHDNPNKAIIPILVIVIILLAVVLAFQAGKHQPEDQTQQAGPNQPDQQAQRAGTDPQTPQTRQTTQAAFDHEFANTPEAVAVQDGEVIDRTELQRRGVRLVDPVPVSQTDSERVKKSVEQRSVYDSLLRWTMYGKVEDKKWAVRALLNMSYAVEVRVIRTVEKNDGNEIVVLYEFPAINTLEILSDVEEIKLDFLTGAKPYLSVGAGVAALWLAPVFDAVLPGTGTAVKIAGTAFPLTTETVAENLALRGYEGMNFALEKLQLSDKKGRILMFGSTDSLQGKKVRITHRDGAVQKIEPVGCDLSEAERDLCANLGVLADYHVMPQDMDFGEKWSVRADQFSNMLDPSMRGVPSGLLEMTRVANSNGALALLDIVGGSIILDSSDSKTTRLGRCVPRGRLVYDVKGGFVKSASLTADIEIDRLSRKHLLFETRFKSTPRLEIQYECSKGSEEVLRIPEEWNKLKIDSSVMPKTLLP